MDHCERSLRGVESEFLRKASDESVSRALMWKVREDGEWPEGWSQPLESSTLWPTEKTGSSINMSFQESLGVFLGGPVVKTPHCQFRGHGFEPWSGTKISHVTWPGQKIKRNKIKIIKMALDSEMCKKFLKSQLCQVFTLWLQANHLTSLGLSIFSIIENGNDISYLNQTICINCPL